MSERDLCKEHSGLEMQVRSVMSTFKWMIGIFIVLSLTVVGFLWRGQVSISNTVISGHKETMDALYELKGKVLILDFKVQQLDTGKQLKEKKN